MDLGARCDKIIKDAVNEIGVAPIVSPVNITNVRNKIFTLILNIFFF